MIVESLSVENFMRYRARCALDFRKRRTIGIVGPNESGKSTLLQAISYGVYGKTRAEREVQLIADGADGDLVVELALRFPDDTRLEITRGRTKKNEAVLRVAGMGDVKPSELQQHIADVVRLSYDDFVALTYFVQGDLHQFMAGNKRAYFQRWASGLRVWQEYEAAAGVQILGLEESIGQSTYAIRDCDKLLEDAASTKAEMRAATAELAQAAEQVDLISGQIEKLQEQYHELAASGRDAQDVVDALRKDVQDAQAQHHAARSAVSSAEADIRAAGSGVCPVLHVKCDTLREASSGQREEAQRRLAAAKSDEKRAVSALADAKRACRQAEQQAQESYLRHLGESRSQLSSAQSDLRDANMRLRRASSRHDAAKVQLSKLKDAAKEKAAAMRDKRKDEVSLRRMQFIRYMCGKSGIPSMLIESELERVEERCNWVLERLDYPKRIRFSGYKELASFEAVCPACGGERWHDGKCKGCGTERPHKRRDDPTVTVLDGTTERPFSLESGGAQVLQSFAVRLACSLFVASLSGVPMRMVMLDEVFGMLDSSNRQKLMGLVIDKLASEFGLQQQFVVSHQEDVVNAVDDLLVVTSERGSAVARWQ